MFKIFDSPNDIDFRQLADVYVESNRMSGAKLYPALLENLQLLYAEQDFYVYIRTFFKEPTAKYAVWLHDGQYVSALRLESYENGLLLNALETKPSFRNNGFAKKLITAVVNYIRGCGSGVLYSHVAKSNTTSLHTHISCGFRIIAEQAVYLDGTIRNDTLTLLLDY